MKSWIFYLSIAALAVVALIFTWSLLPLIAMAIDPH